MKNLAEVKELFGIAPEGTTELKFFSISNVTNPFTEVSNFATQDVQIAQIDGIHYAASLANIDASVATEITV